MKWQVPDALPPGKHTLEFDRVYDGPGLGKGGTGTLKVNGETVDAKEMPKSLPVGIGWVETFNVGSQTGTPVIDHYQVPFRFTGKLDKLTIALGPEQLTEIRRRTRVVGAFPVGQSCLNLAAARLRHIAGTQWSTRKYMNMAPLRAAQTEATGAVVA